MIDLREIRRLVKLLETSNINLLEVEKGGEKIRLVKGNNKIVVLPSVRETKTDNSRVVRESEILTEGKSLAEDIKIQKSKTLGTLYIAPAHDVEAFVHLGDQVTKGQTLCIIESIGIKIGIESEYDGEIVEVFVANTQAVEYDQPLFAIKEIKLSQE